MANVIILIRNMELCEERRKQQDTVRKILKERRRRISIL